MYPYPILFGMNLYDILLAVGVIAAFFCCDAMTQKRGFSVALQKLVIVGILVCVVLGYGFAVLFQAVYNFFDTGVFELAENTGATFYGGLIGGAGAYLLVWFVGGRLFLKDKNAGEEKRRFKDMLDIAACCVPLAHGIGRLGCFFAGCCHGAETDAWYGVEMLTESGWRRVVPIQLFEAVFLITLAIILFGLFFTKPQKLPLMPVYCSGYGVWRFLIEYARADDRGATVISAVTPSQLIAILMILFGVCYLAIFFFNKKQKRTDTSAVEK